MRGEAKLQKNQFGETALLADIEAERAVISHLKDAHCPIRLISEEHGVIDIGTSPSLLGILDGLDGSSVYASQRGKGRYGTMLGIFSNLEPSYEDYLFCGVMIHSPNQELFYADKGGGGFVIVDEERRVITCSGVRELQKTTKLYIDDYFQVNREVFAQRLEGFKLECTGSSAVHYTDVARGAADAAMECTRKQNLEIAVAYGLVTESGGVMVTLDGVSLGQRSYRAFSQDRHTPLVAAATSELAGDIIQRIISRGAVPRGDLR
jgi:fructose-1,6-bisphosphatase/inositol monophosphatase family enzyme